MDKPFSCRRWVLDTGYDATLVQALKSGAHKYKSSLRRESNRWFGECTVQRWKREREQGPTEAMPHVLGEARWMLPDPILPLPGKTMPLPA